MTYITVALIFTGAIYFSSIGYIAGTYILIGLASLHIALVLFSSIIYIVSVATNTSEPPSKSLTTHTQRFMIQLFVAASTYHLYLLGYTILTGSLLITLTITLLSIPLIAILEKK